LIKFRKGSLKQVFTVGIFFFDESSKQGFFQETKQETLDKEDDNNDNKDNNQRKVMVNFASIEPS